MVSNYEWTLINFSKGLFWIPEKQFSRTSDSQTELTFNQKIFLGETFYMSYVVELIFDEHKSNFCYR